jgi:thioredoxin-dependent peroxiredoxin
MKRNSDLVTFGGKPVTLMGRMVEPGHMAKNFAATDSDLNTFNLSEHQGKVRIISAVPSVDTPVCAQQTRRFNEEAAKLSNVKVITISNDLPFALKRFCAAEGIDNLITVSDQKNRDFGIKYGLYIEELGILARAIIVIDQDNEVKYFELVREIAEEPDYDKALEAVKALA